MKIGIGNDHVAVEYKNVIRDVYKRQVVYHLSFIIAGG